MSQLDATDGTPLGNMYQAPTHEGRQRRLAKSKSLQVVDGNAVAITGVGDEFVLDKSLGLSRQTSRAPLVKLRQNLIWTTTLQLIRIDPRFPILLPTLVQLSAYQA
jgi:hypothetical protein